MTGIYICNGKEIMTGTWAVGYNAQKALDVMKLKEKDLGYSVNINGEQFTVKSTEDVDEQSFIIDMNRVK